LVSEVLDMTKDPICGIDAEECDICGSYQGEVDCRGSEGGRESVDKAPSGKVIDFRQRSSELRIKGILSRAVSSLEATKSVAFGLMYLNGEGVPRDPSKAAKFLAIAAKGGVVQAMHELARLHIDGVTVPYDQEYAIRLLQGASDEEHVPSMIYLAELYIFGVHCPKDTDAALELLYRAADKDEPAVMYYLAYIYDKDPDYRNSFEAAYWYRRAAEHGHFKSQIRLACLYATGLGVPHCVDTAEAFLEVALESAPQQDPRFLLWQGERFVAQPETEFLAHALIKAAAEMEHTPAQRLMLQHGWRA